MKKQRKERRIKMYNKNNPKQSTLMKDMTEVLTFYETAAELWGCSKEDIAVKDVELIFTPEDLIIREL